jgi:uncharacterized membrane protein (DUF106 family)
VAILSFLDPVLNLAFGWLLPLPPFWSILILSFILSLLISLIYKFTTNQSVMKDLKTEIKTLQQEMKLLKDNPSKMMEVNKKMFEVNGKYMSHSLKPMLFTFLPVILIFGWLNGHLAFEPIHPNQEFTVTTVFDKAAMGNVTLFVPDGITMTGDTTKTIEAGTASFAMKGYEGLYSLTFEHGGKQYVKDVEITQKREYVTPALTVNDGTLKSIMTNHEKTIVIQIGSWGVSWFWSYLVFSLIFSLVIRKALKIY